MIVTIYILSILYCIWRMTVSYQKRNEADPTYASPGLETLAILLMAPVLMAVDVSYLWVRKYKEYRQEKADKIF